MNVNVNGTNYVISDGLVSKKFALSENPDCFIEFTVVDINLLKIDLFKCSSTAGTGRILMYDLFYFLITNNYITQQTKVTLVPAAYVLYVERITPNQPNLLEYYYKLGFDKRESIDENGVITLSGIVGHIMWNISQYLNTTVIDHDEENQFYSQGGKRSRSKKGKSKKGKSKKSKSKKSKKRIFISSSLP